MRSINLCIPTLNRYDKLAECINSAIIGSLKPTQINVVDNGCKFKEFFGDIDNVDGVTLQLFTPKINYGVGRSWNYFLHTQEDYVIICNDDVIFHKNTVELLIKAAEQNPVELFFTPDGYWEHYWSCFLQKTESLALVGEYDGNFYPGYYEDRDYKYRMKLAGFKVNVVEGCEYTHSENGSNSIKQMESNERQLFNQRFNQLAQYYQGKWGGYPENETFIKPFNLIG